MLRNVFLLSVGFLVTLLSGCATSAPFVKEVVDDADRTVFLLQYEIMNPDPDWSSECSLEVTRLENRHMDTIPLPRTKKFMQVEVPPGKYKFGMLTCGRAKWDMLNFGAPSVEAKEGKVNYLGRFGFQIAQFEKFNQLNILKGDREETRKALTSLSQRMIPRWRRRVVSAYNGAVIPDHYIKDLGNYKRGILSHTTGPKPTLNLMNFEVCEKAEFNINPAPLGILSYRLTFQTDKVSSFQRVKSENTFSPDYIDCVEDTLRSFIPGYTGKVDYDINL